MTLQSSGAISHSDVNVELGLSAGYSSTLSFLNNYIVAGQRPTTPNMNAFYSLTYYQNNQNGNCSNGNCSAPGSACLYQCVNCTLTTVNCANCDAQKWLQTGTNCFSGSYNCAQVASRLYDCSNCSKIVCGKLYEFGLMSQNIWSADQAYGRELRKTEKDIYRGYIRWARPVTQWMDGRGSDFMIWIPKSRRAEAQKELMIELTHRVGAPWSEHMAYSMGAIRNDNEQGRVLMKIGRFFCKWVELIPRVPTKYKRSAILFPYSLLSSYTIWFLLEFSYYTSKAYLKAVELKNKVSEGKLTNV